MTAATDAKSVLEQAIGLYTTTHLMDETGDEDTFPVAWVLVIEATSPTLDAGDRYELLRSAPDGQRMAHTRGLLHEALDDLRGVGGCDE